MQRKVFKPVGVFIEPLMQVLVYPTQYQLMYSLGRFQEFYENPELRDKVFSREDLQEWQPDYYVRWNGCNFPWKVVAEFNRLRFVPDAHEQEFLRIVLPLRYVVGVHLGMGEEMAGTMRHERMHAYYASDGDYRNRLQGLADKETAISTRVFEALLKRGYGHNVLLDEYQAWAVNGEWEKELGMACPETALVVAHARATAKTYEERIR